MYFKSTMITKDKSNIKYILNNIHSIAYTKIAGQCSNLSILRKYKILAVL